MGSVIYSPAVMAYTMVLGLAIAVFVWRSGDSHRQRPTPPQARWLLVWSALALAASLGIAAVVGQADVRTLPSWSHSWLAGIGAFVVASGLTWWMSSRWGDHPLSPSTLLGNTAQLTSHRVDGQMGEAKLAWNNTDLVLQVRCDKPNYLKRGEYLLLTEYDPDREAFVVEPLTTAKVSPLPTLEQLGNRLSKLTPRPAPTATGTRSRAEASSTDVEARPRW